RFWGCEQNQMRNYLDGSMFVFKVEFGRDGNNHIFPVAWVVVSVEDKENWSWFLQLLVDDLEVPNGNGLTLMSDQHKGLIEAVKDVMPLAEYRQCARHIYEGFRKQFSEVEFREVGAMKLWKMGLVRCLFSVLVSDEILEHSKDQQRFWLVIPCGDNQFEVRRGSDAFKDRYMLTYSHYLKPIDGINFWPDCSHLSRILGPKPRKMPDERKKDKGGRLMPAQRLGRMGIWLGMDVGYIDPIVLDLGLMLLCLGLGKNWEMRDIKGESNTIPRYKMRGLKSWKNGVAN
ncbi:pentatricopeptide repeat-containing protein, partial [Tanacetum coccineum]